LSNGDGSVHAWFFVNSQNLSEETGTLIGACQTQHNRIKNQHVLPNQQILHYSDLHYQQENNSGKPHIQQQRYIQQNALQLTIRNSQNV